ncbi:MAG: glycosyltransferase family 2 protein [Solirubrobacterales bacterium]
MHTPRVSVIIPTYNRATYVPRAIDSVLSQKYRDLEIIVVDDGSKDNTREVVAAYGAPVRYIFQENQGPGAARNQGIRVAAGAYLAFLDSDDVWMPTFLEKTVSALDEHPEVGVATTGIYLGYKDRKVIGHLDGIETGVWELSAGLSDWQIRQVLSGFCPAAVLARADVVKKYGGYYEHRCMLGEDVYLWIQVVLNHRVYRIREPLLWYDTEASGLGLSSGKAHYPLEPVLVDPDPIWRNCPEQHREFLSRWLASHALKTIHLQIATGDHENARWLLEHYPRVREWTCDWLRIRFKLAFPGVAGVLRRIKLRLARQSSGGRARAV